MKAQKKITAWPRMLLGLFLIVYALNQFFQILPTSYGTMPENTENFLDAVVVYLPVLYIFEILIGLLLIFNKWTPFLIIVLFPLSITFLIFVISNCDISKMWPAFIVALLNIWLLWMHRGKYKPLFS
ncbi:MAG: DoxX protein [Altibacter sp.]|uniref:DoxX protein n=1 Tax=Altibacter sp. TaxID=2024823 RepID=UPI001D85C683|nr:DoxX protein [Altibacter sp.]MBZ0326005.1 DoxX protein [Altibacter sp.]